MWPRPRSRRPSPGLTILATLISTLALPSASHAAWPHGTGINVPICTAANSQYRPRIVSDGAGGAIITWDDYRSGTGSDIYAQRVLASGVVDPAWPADGRALCTQTNNQVSPAIVSDGAGGAIVTWNDFRSGTSYDIYAQRVLASGAVDPAWPDDGRALCTATNFQDLPTIVSDGAGGAIVTWEDSRNGTSYDIYAQRVLASGAVDPAWPADGRALCTAVNNQYSPTIVSDGVGGAIVTWYDYRSGTSYDIYAQRVLASGAVDPAWPADGRALCTAAGQQDSPVIVSDGAGGAIVTWHDNRSGANYDIYAQRVLASGAVDPAWPPDGQALSTTGNSQIFPTIVSDGAGGAIVTWQDYRSGTNYDIYAQHVLASGAVDGVWGFDGLALCTQINDQYYPTIASDGAGGAIVTWHDYRGGGGGPQIFAHHVLASGVVDATWPTDGRTVCAAPYSQFSPTIVSDGAGGAIVTWYDERTGASSDIYAQRVAPSGYLGNPEPRLVSVQDVPNDNGGKVKLSWTASYLDTEQPYVVDHYWIFRSAPPNEAAQAVAAGARLLRAGDLEPLPGERAFLAAAPVQSATTYAWEYVASSPAAHFASSYSYVATTTGDSIGAGNPRTAFLVVAYNAANTLYILSNPDSGYSVDDLPPVTPAPFTGAYQAGATHLHWARNLEPDLAGYRIYRGGSAGFVPGPGNLVASPADTGHADVGPAGGFYKLSAVDVHGNESGFALLTPSGTTGVPGAGVPGELYFGQPTPNPAAALATVRLALPRAARVSLAIHDVAGREVRGLFSGTMDAGERDVTWDLRQSSGARAANGLYFLRLAVDGRAIVRRVVVVH